MTVLGRKSGKNAPNVAFFWQRYFLLIYNKSAENKLSFEVHAILDEIVAGL